MGSFVLWFRNTKRQRLIIIHNPISSQGTATETKPENIKSGTKSVTKFGKCESLPKKTLWGPLLSSPFLGSPIHRWHHTMAWQKRPLASRCRLVKSYRWGVKGELHDTYINVVKWSAGRLGEKKTEQRWTGKNCSWAWVWENMC